MSTLHSRYHQTINLIHKQTKEIHAQGNNEPPDPPFYEKPETPILPMPTAPVGRNTETKSHKLSIYHTRSSLSSEQKITQGHFDPGKNIR